MTIADLPGSPVSLARDLIASIEAKPLSPSDYLSAAWFSLDAIACVCGALPDPAARPVLAWGASEKVTVARRAFILGALSNILEMDAMHRASATHPGTVVVPAALSVALAMRSTGRDFLRAVLRGFEASARIGQAAGAQHARLYQATSTCCAFGAAASASDLLGLSASERLQAFGNAGTRCGGLWQFVEDGALSKQWHAGRASEDGVLCAQLAHYGFTGPERILEGGKGFFAVMCPESDTSVLTQSERAWALHDVSYKPWPSPRHTHPAIDAALKLSGRIQGEIASVRVTTYPVVLQLCNQIDPQTDHAARFSTAYCVAAALQDGCIDETSFAASARVRHGGLARRVTVEASKRFATAFPAAWGAEVIVDMADGSRLVSDVEHAKGDPLSPMTEEERLKKALAMLERGAVERASELADRILAMPETDEFPHEAVARALGSAAGSAQ